MNLVLAVTYVGGISPLFHSMYLGMRQPGKWAQLCEYTIYLVRTLLLLTQLQCQESYYQLTFGLSPVLTARGVTLPLAH